MLDLSTIPIRDAATTNPQQPSPPPSAVSETGHAALLDGKDMPIIGIEKPPHVDQIELQRRVEGLTNFARSIDTDISFQVEA